MRIKFYSKVMAWMLCAAMSCWSIAANAQPDPVVMLQSVADQMISGLKANKATLKTNPGYVYSLSRRLIVPRADLTEMSKRVLPPQTWNQATPSQRAQFQKEFTTLLVRTYGSALASYKDETIQFYPVRGGYAGKSSVKVDSQVIRSEGPSIPISYRLFYNGSQWKLYDLVVEGVSLLESFRSQFADKLSQGDIQSLIQDIAAHNSSNARRD
jgi:phospholipid transport system substrate-binding protein